MDKFILFEPILIGELLTVISTFILLIITWRSVSNAKIANQITKESMEIQKEQFKYSIKPNLIFEIPPIEYTENENNKMNTKDLIFPDHIFHIRNITTNICYNINVTTFVYLPDVGWDSYYKFIQEVLGGKKRRPNIVTRNDTHSLYNDNIITGSIPFYFTNLNITSYDGTIPSPVLYVFLTYEDSISNIYNECFKLQQTHSVQGKFNEPDEIKLIFKPQKTSWSLARDKLYEQKTKLESEFPNLSKLFYYDL